MKQVFVQSIPFDKNVVTLALESGVDGLIVEPGDVDKVLALAKAEVRTPGDFAVVTLASKADEQIAVKELAAGREVILKRGCKLKDTGKDSRDSLRNDTDEITGSG